VEQARPRPHELWDKTRGQKVGIARRVVRRATQPSRQYLHEEEAKMFHVKHFCGPFAGKPVHLCAITKQNENWMNAKSIHPLANHKKGIQEAAPA
jgi:hypothetical protein